MQAMKGATGVLGSMNKSMNLPALQRIAMEFEKENDIMDQRQEMMDDAIDDVTGLEDEAEEEEVVEQILEEIGVDLRQAVSSSRPSSSSSSMLQALNPNRWAKHHPVFRLPLYRKARLRRLLEGAGVGEEIQETTIFKRDLTACDDDANGEGLPQRRYNDIVYAALSGWSFRRALRYA